MAGKTPTYNLKAVIHETGLSPATLRAWERRYGLLKPQRSAGGHRLYTEDDIQMLKWLVARQAEGLSISHAIELWRSLEETGPQPPRLAPVPLLHTTTAHTTIDELRREWIQACLVFNEQAAEQALNEALAFTTPETVCTELLQKGLAEIGSGWYAGAVSVQQEHFASALAMRRLSALFAATAAPTRSERILAACPPGEQHDFVLLMLAFLLRRRGWDVVYLGANVPLARLDSTVRLVSPSLILSVAQTLNSAAALQEMAAFAASLHIPFAYGGGIFNIIPDLHARIPGHYLGNDLALATQHIESWVARPTPLPEVALPNLAYRQLLEHFLAKEALIINSVTAEILARQLSLDHIEEANTNFTSNIIAALKLGDIHFLDYSVGWLEGLLQNYGLAPQLANQYFAAYRLAVQQHLGDEAAPILDWLAKYQTPSS